MARLKFLRRHATKLSRLGKNRKKLQKWRSPKGRDNKMRLREKGYPRTVEIGYKKCKYIREKVEGKEVVYIENIKDIEKAKKENTLIIKNIGMKKKIEIAKKADEKGLKIKNLNVKKFLSEVKKWNLIQRKN